MFPDYFFNIYERWASVIGRILLALVFLSGAYFKIPGTNMFRSEVGFTAAAGVPLPFVAVILAFFLEIIAAILLIIRRTTRITAFVLVLYTILLTFLFHFSFKNPQDIGMFISHLGLIGGLLYVSACDQKDVSK